MLTMRMLVRRVKLPKYVTNNQYLDGDGASEAISALCTIYSLNMKPLKYPHRHTYTHSLTHSSATNQHFPGCLKLQGSLWPPLSVGEWSRWTACYFSHIATLWTCSKDRYPRFLEGVGIRRVSNGFIVDVLYILPYLYRGWSERSEQTVTVKPMALHSGWVRESSCANKSSGFAGVATTNWAHIRDLSETTARHITSCLVWATWLVNHMDQSSAACEKHTVSPHR